ncbi:phosphoadenylyl-sulfate reductase [Methylobacterium gnaphalii]|uniref:Adenosine 5'-phosphosulfate reductase n=1 Tax=Methylobacterium gnaphalii TaxID=1010610 RepID=A0A512JN84_9HYPH|nr:phosphoadenylyl-sulfate reductase [Methylobacterium gnaphalii]GEP11419.1 phosphoadenosine phosphosulfate reductase [Methylobacterium gnaphalii]GJD69833.1 Thioredoxin-dependent 5'-adenylylsulfate reductase [Methylobacterium gnaphalii]GLS48013.1 phosphoadenosine phosphosulfate reductase [Methylobacterium gnaphalii]
MTVALVQQAERLAERLAGLDLTGRIRLVEAEIPGRLVFTTSLGIEDQVLTHAIALAKGRTEIVTLDTGRLFPETYDLWAETEAAYGIRIRAYAPERTSEEAFVAREGINGFRHSVEARQACCGFRKVEPLGRALDQAAVWFTGLRAGQSANRADTPLAEADEQRGLIKVNPLADWTRAQIDAFVKDNFIPYNALHDRGFPSIGCAPCTRAVRIGEDERAGRWWWEQESKKECGLHVHRPEEDVAPGQEPAAFEEPARAATSREYRRELV